MDSINLIVIYDGTCNLYQWEQIFIINNKKYIIMWPPNQNVTIIVIKIMQFKKKGYILDKYIIVVYKTNLIRTKSNYINVFQMFTSKC